MGKGRVSTAILPTLMVAPEATASSQSQHCLIKEFPDNSRAPLPILNVSGVLRGPKRGSKLAKYPDREIKCSGNLLTAVVDIGVERVEALGCHFAWI
jgi:hypothetical protein